MPDIFQPLAPAERNRLIQALHANAYRGKALATDQKDTSFVGVMEEISDQEVINAIKSVPVHY